jgi:thiol-disulfide isomerase/thioredoxin
MLSVLALVFVFSAVYPAMVRPGTAAPSEKFSQAPQSTLVFIHMDGCGWCDRFKPTWEELEKKHGATTLKAAGVSLASHERKEPGAKAYDAHVSGYPTILLDKGGGDVKVFDGERTVEALLKFVGAQ